MTFNEYRSYDALGLAELVSKKEIQPMELVDLAFSRIEEVNPKLNAIVYQSKEYAQSMAAKLPSNGMLKGVPILIKDLALQIKDYPIWNGSRGFRGAKGDEDSFVIQSLKEEGAVIIGRTHCPEFGLLPVSESNLWGNCRNPWRDDLDPGGSSGGSAVAISSGIVPIASGSDIGGSLRIPASCCGLFGFKPSRGRVSLGRLYGEAASGAMVEHCISRTVRDSAAYLETVSGYWEGELNLKNKLYPGFQDQLLVPPKRLKVGYCTESPLGNKVHPDCINAVHFTTKLLSELGHEVEEVIIPYDKEVCTEVHLDMVFCETAATINSLESFLRRKTDWKEIEINTRILGALGELYSAKEYILSKERWNDSARKMGEFHKKFDVLLSPTLSVPYFKIGEFANKRYEEIALKFISKLRLERVFRKEIISKIQTSAEKVPFTQIANITGQPAMSIPLFWNENKLPIGVMFMGAIGSELLLFKLAKQLEDAAPWFDKVPEI